MHAKGEEGKPSQISTDHCVHAKGNAGSQSTKYDDPSVKVNGHAGRPGRCSVFHCVHAKGDAGRID